jgi:CheY-like chemotaxis protein
MNRVEHPAATAVVPSGAAREGSPRLARVIILEDDAPTRQALVEALEGAGYLTCAGERGAEILEQLSEFRPNLILLDMLLPEMDGFEFLARLRTHPMGAEVPVVIVSNLGESLVDCIDPEAARAIGVSAIFPKSIALSTLLAHLARLLRPEDRRESGT